MHGSLLDVWKTVVDWLHRHRHRVSNLDTIAPVRYCSRGEAEASMLLCAAPMPGKGSECRSRTLEAERALHGLDLWS